MRTAKKGGCHAAGPLTSQGLLHVMASLGLIPIELAQWGEVALDQPHLVDHKITLENGRADQFLASLALSLEVPLSQAEQINCKYARHYRKGENKCWDAIYGGQLVHAIENSTSLFRIDRKTRTEIDVPATSWPDNRCYRDVDDYFWFVPTYKRVRGANRVRNGRRLKLKTQQKKN